MRCRIQIIAFLLIGCSTLVFAAEGSRLAKYQNATTDQQRLSALLEIGRCPSKVAPELISFLNRYEGDPTLISGEISLCALVKDAKLVPALLRLYKKQEADEAACIYCCPLRLVLQLYFLNGLFDPSKEDLAKDEIGELTLSNRTIFQSLSRAEIEGNITDPSLAVQLKRVESQTLKGVIKAAADRGNEPMPRVFAAGELYYRSPGGATTVELLWLSTIPSNDMAGEYDCYLYDAILRNEYYAGKKKK